MRLAFGDVVFDSGRRQLERDGRPVHLSPKAFQLFECLIEAAPSAVSRDAIYQKLWGDTFVVDANLPNLVSEIRAALGDSHREPRFIRTVHRHGYAFLGDTSSTSTGRFVLEWGTHSFELRDGVNLLGRDASSAARIESSAVSRTHAAIVIRGAAASIEDRGSKNGTFVGDERVSAPRELRSGDVIRLGSVRMTFRSRPDAESTMTEAIPASGASQPERRVARDRRMATGT